jgi:hypothetical protein
MEKETEKEMEKEMEREREKAPDSGQPSSPQPSYMLRLLWIQQSLPW